MDFTSNWLLIDVVRVQLISTVTYQIFIAIIQTSTSELYIRAVYKMEADAAISETAIFTRKMRGVSFQKRMQNVLFVLQFSITRPWKAS